MVNMKQEWKQVDELLLDRWQLPFDSTKTLTMYQGEASTYSVQILASDSIAVVNGLGHTSDGGSLELLLF